MTDAPKDLNDALDKADMSFTDWHVNGVRAAYVRAAYLRGLEDAAKEIDCGCPQREAVLSAKNKYERAGLCGREPCAAEDAAAIRARAEQARNGTD